MTTKLIQRQFLKGSREFEIVNETVYVSIKRPLKEEKLTVGLATLDPEPVVNKPYLEFHGRIKTGPVLSLFLNQPNTEEFNAFVDTLRQRVLEESDTFVEVNPVAQAEGLALNVYEVPPEFDESEWARSEKNRPTVVVAEIETAIHMLETYLKSEDIRSLLSTLEALKTEPQNESHLEQLENAFSDLGIMQGAVLTYAPYIGTLLSDDPFGHN